MTNTTKPALSAAPVAQEPVARLCGYCKTWNSKPCGEQCYLQPSDPVWTSPPATPAGDQPVGYISPGTRKALIDPHGAGPIVAAAGYDTTIPVYLKPQAGVGAEPDHE